MNHSQIISAVAKQVKEKFLHDTSGHDWWHIDRVWQLTKYIVRKENANPLIAELGALLHDIADFKFHDGDLSAGPNAAKIILEPYALDSTTLNIILDIIGNVSFKGAQNYDKPKSLEGQIVQDADRLDAIGAIGIARCFTYNGHVGHDMYNPNQVTTKYQTAEEYRLSRATAINHFYEKLLLLKDRMNTTTAKAIARKRHQFMEEYLQEFYLEWAGKDLIT